jgi:UDP-N-acetylmuramoyl-tripeptide--D-alanyl-D-alanine ligase
MRLFIRSLLLTLLAVAARAVIRRYRPLVVMVTGSVGKTSTKDAAAAVLGQHFLVRKSEKSFNSNIGVPLTILGVKNPWSNPFKWLGILLRACILLLTYRPYPKLLVLEVGADQPGDLAEIFMIVRPDVTVVTLLPEVPVHVEAYENPEAVRQEEFSPARVLATGAPLIYNSRDAYASRYAEEGTATPYTFGMDADAHVNIVDVRIWEEDGVLLGMQAELIVRETSYPIRVQQAVGTSQLYAPAAAVATGLALGMGMSEILKGLDSYVPPPGRGRVFKGKKHMALIDDTYNSSPAATEEILRSLPRIPTSGRRVAILGDMLELGEYSLAEHARMGHIAAETVDVLVTVGERARAAAAAARADGMPADAVYEFPTSIAAVATLEEILREGDCVLIKGSQGVRMERIVRPFLQDLSDVPHLVRQDAEWQRR